MSDLAWTIIAGIACIIIAYGFGLQYGYHRGYRDACLDQAIKDAETEAKKKYGRNTGSISG